MNNHRNTFFAAIFAASILLFSFSCHSEETPPSSISTDDPVCKYVEPMEIPDDGRPDFFGDIKGIYIFDDLSVLTPELRNQPLFRSESITALAACALKKQLTPDFMAAHGLNIYTPPYYYSNVPEVKEDRNLTIVISVQIRDGKKTYKKIAQEYDGLFKEKDVIVQVRYYRPDMISEIFTLEHCVTVFPYTTDTDLYHKLLTRSLQVCLNQQYHYSGLIFRR